MCRGYEVSSSIFPTATPQEDLFAIRRGLAERVCGVISHNWAATKLQINRWTALGGEGYNNAMSTPVPTFKTSTDANLEFDILRDEAFFRAHEAEFMRDYPGKFLAIRGEEIFGISDTRRGLIELAYHRFGHDVYFFAREVCPESFAPPGDPVYLFL